MIHGSVEDVIFSIVLFVITAMIVEVFFLEAC